MHITNRHMGQFTWCLTLPALACMYNTHHGRHDHCVTRSGSVLQHISRLRAMTRYCTNTSIIYTHTWLCACVRAYVHFHKSICLCRCTHLSIQLPVSVHLCSFAMCNQSSMHHCLLTSTQGHKVCSLQALKAMTPHELALVYNYVYLSFCIIILQLVLYITQQACIISYDWQLVRVHLKFRDWGPHVHMYMNIMCNIVAQ